MELLRTARTLVGALAARPALALFSVSDDLDEVWEPFLRDGDD
ncbi:hypothetical protein [Aquihabitans sp. G128]|nr:hypothetical protein [Aquihabitans sp. G128]